MEHAADINAALDAQFTPLVQVLQALRDSGVTLSLSYTLTQQEDVYRLDASVSAPGMNVLALSAYTLRPADGTAACADPAQQALWGDATLWRDLLVLRGAGIPVDFAACTQPLSTRQAAAWLINAYEQQAGHAVDDAGILPSVTDPVLRKSYALSLLDYVGGEEGADANAAYAEELTAPELFALMARYAQATDRTLLGLGSQAVSVSDALARLRPLVEAFSPYAADWSAWMGDIPMEDDSLSRQQWAGLLVRRYEAQFGAVTASPYARELRDTADKNDQKAVEANLVLPYPAYPLFCSDRLVRYDTFPALMEQALCAFYEQITPQQARAQADGQPAWMRTEADTNRVCTPRALHILAPLAAYYQQQTAPQVQPQTVRNLRDWDFYYSQYETGPYSLMNCMPTITAMALKWQKQDFSVTPEQIRARYPGDGGWYFYQVTESLDFYQGRYETASLLSGDAQANIDALCARLDQGCILLSQMHEGDPVETGHCMVIYGYRRWGDSTWFYIYDPGDSPVSNAYGVAPGKMRMLEAYYAEWIMERFTDSYIVMLP